MVIGLEDLNTFKMHRNKVSESLDNIIVGRDKEIQELCELLLTNNYVAIIGPSGCGKSRLATAVIENFQSIHSNYKIKCTKSFSDYMSDISENIGDENFILFVDDANDYSKLIDMMKLIKYINNGNIKVILTIRDYLINCLSDEEEVYLYKISSLNAQNVKMAISKNTIIKNEKWLNKIAEVASGNIRVAFLAANNSLNDNNGFYKLYSQQSVLNKFYKRQILQITNSSELLKTLFTISFFRNIYLEYIFYIEPILNLLRLNKSVFIDCVNQLIKLEIVDDYKNVIKMSDQCFADYLLNYFLIEKKHVKFQDLVQVGV